MMLTQLATVKARLALDSFDIADDVFLVNFILSASARFELECNRKFERTVDDTHEFPGDAWEILPPRYPVESISAFHLKSNETDGWAAAIGYDFLVKSGGARVSLVATLGTCDQLARMTYTGGYVLPGYVPDAGQTPLPAELEHACTEQVCNWYQRRNQLGLSAISGEGGSITQPQPADLLPHIRPILARYTRLVI